MKGDNRGLLFVLGGLALLILVGPVFAGGMMGSGWFGPGMMGWGVPYGNASTSGNGWPWGLAMGVGGLMMLAFWGLIIAGIVVFVRWIGTQQAPGAGSQPGAPEDPLTILRRRYAAGEIDQKTFERIKAELGGIDGWETSRQPVATDGVTTGVPGQTG